MTAEFRENDDEMIRIFRYRPETSVFFKTKRQEVAVLDTTLFGRTLFLDGILQSAKYDEEIYHKFLVHSIFRPQSEPVRVLILGGGEGATLREVLKWKHVSSVHMIDWDQELVEYFRDHEPSWHQDAFLDPRVTLEFADVFELPDTNRGPYDTIIVDLTDPDPGDQRWAALLNQLTKWLAIGGSMIVNGGGVFPWDQGLIPVLRSYLANTCLDCQTHQVKKWIPSFGREWGFVILKKSL